MKLVNIFNHNREITLFCRNDNGDLEIKIVKDFFPYFYEKSFDGNFKSYKGDNLRKMFVSLPSDVPKQRSNDAFEADILFHRRYIIDKIDKFEKSKIKYAFIDIEILADELPDIRKADKPISCITIYNSFNKEYKQFYLGDYKTEFQLMDNFVYYMKQEQFDLLLGWNFTRFDFPYLCNRYPDFAKKISPIDMNRYGDGEIEYPAGISIVDYLCVDEETEILTNDGWKTYYNISKSNKAIAYDIKTETLKEARIKDIYNYDYDGEMYEIKNKRTNQLITPNHRILTLTKDTKDQYGYYRFFEPKDITSWRYLPLSPKKGYKGKYTKLSNDEVRLIGWIISEGSWTQKDPAIRIAQSKPNYVKEIDRLLLKLNLDYSIYKTKNLDSTFFNKSLNKIIHRNWEQIQFRISSKDSRKFKTILQNKKELNYNLLNLPLKQSRILVETLIKGDGSFGKGSVYGTFYQKDYLLSSQIQELGIKCGFATSLRKVTGRNYYQMTFSTRWLTGGGKNIIPKKKHYKGKVWCINTKYGTIVCRRKGQVFITGNSWFKKVTLNREKQYSLDYIAQQHLGKGKQNKPDFSKLSTELKRRNKEDVEIMVKLEEKKKVISYFDEIRRLSQVEWEDLMFNSRVLDILLLKEAKKRNVILPMKPSEDRNTLEDKPDFKGAYRHLFKPGCHFNIGSYDISSAYPIMITNFCLDYSTLRDKEEDNCIPIQIFNPVRDKKTNELQFGENKKLKVYLDNKYYFKQDKNALLPIVIKKLMKLKNDIKTKLKSLKLETEEYEDTKQFYDAIKTVINSAYGVFGNRYFRLFSKEVAESTTFLVRDFLDYIITNLTKQGYKIIYVDTDGIMIANHKEDISPLLKDLSKKWAKERFNKEDLDIDFEFEGLYEKLLLLARCRYKGYKRTEKGLEEITRGIESKRKDSTIFMSKFQNKLIEKIFNKESESKVISWINEQIKEIKNQPLKDIAFPCKLSKKLEDYKNRPIFARALEITKDFNKKIGNSYYWIYVKPFGYEEKEEEIFLYKGKRFTNSKLKEPWKEYYGEDILVKNMDDDRKEQLMQKLIEKGDLVKSIRIVKGKAKNVLAFDEDNFDHIKRENIDWITMIQRNILNKCEVIFQAMGWDIEKLNKKDNNFAEEVSKETRLVSNQESRVRVPNSAPNILQKKYKKIQEQKAQVKELKDFELSDLEIKELDYSIAKEYISENHYSQTLGSSIKLSLGFYYKKELVTAIIYGDPIGINAKDFLQCNKNQTLELVRLFSKDGLPKNTESYCISQSFKYIKSNKPEFKYLLSYADANHGHVGYIYQATNWKYIGLSAKDGHPRIFIDGKEKHPRSLYSQHGTSSIKKLKNIYGNRLQTQKKLQKHVYLMCLGNKKERREWYKKFPEKPYPKINKDNK